jgi:hypothetical protein
MDRTFLCQQLLRVGLFEKAELDAIGSVCAMCMVPCYIADDSLQFIKYLIKTSRRGRRTRFKGTVA